MFSSCVVLPLPSPSTHPAARAQVDLYYNGYCNNVLWPLFHYVPLPFEARLDETTNVQTQWEAYKRANRQFATAVLGQYRDGDAVWCHDYHLLLTPALLREREPKMKAIPRCPAFPDLPPRAHAAPACSVAPLLLERQCAVSPPLSPASIVFLKSFLLGESGGRVGGGRSAGFCTRPSPVARSTARCRCARSCCTPCSRQTLWGARSARPYRPLPLSAAVRRLLGRNEGRGCHSIRAAAPWTERARSRPSGRGRGGPRCTEAMRCGPRCTEAVRCGPRGTAGSTRTIMRATSCRPARASWAWRRAFAIFAHRRAPLALASSTGQAPARSRGLPAPAFDASAVAGAVVLGRTKAHGAERWRRLRGCRALRRAWRTTAHPRVLLRFPSALTPTASSRLSTRTRSRPTSPSCARASPAARLVAPRNPRPRPRPQPPAYTQQVLLLL